MIIFSFSINKSFIKYSSHPLTIPKSQVNYTNLTNFKLDDGDYIIIFPKCEILSGYIYSGNAGYGGYYQIKTYSGQDIPDYMLLNDQLIAILFHYSRKSHCIMEYCK
ncbi:MAG: hypothetical protein ACTSWK_09800 [Promethearchaeota archaeon]